MNEKRRPGRPKGTVKGGVLRYLRDDELNRFLKAASKSKRDDLLFSLIFFLGLRVSEAVQMDLKAFNMEAYQVTVRALKGGKTRSYDLPGWLVVKLNRWLKERAKRFYSGNPFLFPHKIFHDGHFSKDGVQWLFKQLCQKAGIAGHSVHDLRHTTAVLLVKEGANAARVRNWLRHKSLMSSQVYFEEFEDREFEKEASGVFERFAK